MGMYRERLGGPEIVHLLRSATYTDDRIFVYEGCVSSNRSHLCSNKACMTQNHNYNRENKGAKSYKDIIIILQNNCAV